MESLLFLVLSDSLTWYCLVPFGIYHLLQSHWIACAFSTRGFESQSRNPHYRILSSHPRRVSHQEGDCSSLSFSCAFSPCWQWLPAIMSWELGPHMHLGCLKTGLWHGKIRIQIKLYIDITSPGMKLTLVKFKLSTHSPLIPVPCLTKDTQK